MSATIGSTLRPRILGVVFLALLLVAVWLTYALFTQKFADFDTVTLRTQRVGLQLPERADVKARGVIVGQVLDRQVTDDGAEITLRLDPDQVATIPGNVTGAILPKTLFGQKYVSLVIPEDPSSRAIAEGDVIDRTAISIEVQKVLDDIYPLLRSIQPADLNYTLNALATALEGRGEQLGRTLTDLDAYLKKLNPQIPLLLDDLRKTSRVSDLYADVLPQVSQVLRDSVVTTGTLEDREQQVGALLTDVTAFSRTTDRFLRNNGDDLIRLGEVSAPVVRTLARYSPEFPCLLGGLNRQRPMLAEAFRGYTLHIDLETLPRQARAYTPRDAPRFGEDRGPRCGQLANPPWSQQNPYTDVPNFDDGVDEPTGKGTMRAGVGGAADGRPVTGASYVGTPAERRVLNELIAPAMGTEPDRVPDLGALLIGPMARGATVELR